MGFPRIPCYGLWRCYDILAETPFPASSAWSTPLFKSHFRCRLLFDAFLDLPAWMMCLPYPPRDAVCMLFQLPMPLNVETNAGSFLTFDRFPLWTPFMQHMVVTQHIIKKKQDVRRMGRKSRKGGNEKGGRRKKVRRGLRGKWKYFEYSQFKAAFKEKMFIFLHEVDSGISV